MKKYPDSFESGYLNLKIERLNLEKLSAIQFESFQDYFKYRLQNEFVSAAGHKKSNLEKLAKALGYNSASSLSMIFTGDRLPSNDFLDAISNHWKLSHEEDLYLRNIVQLEKLKKKGKATKQVMERLGRFKKMNLSHKLSLNQFSMMRDWYHLVIQTLISSFDFREDHTWISRKLRRKVSPAQIKKSIEILLELGVVQRNSEGLLEPVLAEVETTHELASEAIREHHKGMMSRAIEAVDEQDVSARHFNSLTLKFDPVKMTQAKEKILNFVKDFNTEFDADDSNQIYQLNLQFFEHTKDEKNPEAQSHANN